MNPPEPIPLRTVRVSLNDFHALLQRLPFVSEEEGVRLKFEFFNKQGLCPNGHNDAVEIILVLYCPGTDKLCEFNCEGPHKCKAHDETGKKAAGVTRRSEPEGGDAGV